MSPGGRGGARRPNGSGRDPGEGDAPAVHPFDAQYTVAPVVIDAFTDLRAV